MNTAQNRDFARRWFLAETVSDALKTFRTRSEPFCTRSKSFPSRWKLFRVPPRERFRAFRELSLAKVIRAVSLRSAAAPAIAACGELLFVLSALCDVVSFVTLR